MEVKKTSLRRVLNLYVYKIFLIIGVLILIVVAYFLLLFHPGILLPANYQERLIFEAKPMIAEADIITSEMIPDGVEYVLLNLEGTEILDAGNMSQRRLNQMWKYLEENISPRGLGNPRFSIIESVNSKCIVYYTITSRFSNPILHRMIPYPELTLLILCLGIFVVAILILSRQTTKELKKELQKLLDVAENIEQQNLDFDSEPNRFKEFQTITDSLDRTKNALKQSLEEQIKSEQARAQQISALAHDIKIPVTVIRGNVELLGMTYLNPKQIEFAEDIHAATLQIEGYSRSLVELSQLNTSFSLNKSEVSLSQLLDEVQSTFKSYSRHQHIEFEIINSLPPTTSLLIDEQLVQRAILNTLHNAMEHGGSTSKITLNTSLNQGLVIEIQDDGDGFNEEALKHGTQLFYTQNKARSGDTHYGIGLNFASQVAKLHQGTFTIQNTNKGGQVRFIFPSDIVICF